MKVSAAVSLCIAPLVLAKAVRNVYPAHARRSQQVEDRDSRVSVKSNPNAGTVSGLTPAELNALGLGGVEQTENVEVVFLWVFPGGQEATTVINPPSTTTVTVTQNGGAAAVTAPPAAGGDAAVSSATTGDVATSVVGAGGATHSVSVGGAAGLAYDPPSIVGAVGDTVIFTFYQTNHTVTQSAFNTPCEPLEGGMDSGFQPNPNNSVNPPPQVAMQLMVGTPLWFYCKQKGHCGKGMTFSINPTAEKTQALFQSMAIAQNGTGAESTITGGTPGAAAAAPPPPPAAGDAAASSGVAPAGGDAAATATTTGTDLASAPTGSVAVGTGQIDPSSGACQCAVVCTSVNFPVAGVQGVGAFGGMGGSISQAMVGST